MYGSVQRLGTLPLSPPLHWPWASTLSLYSSLAEGYDSGGLFWAPGHICPLQIKSITHGTLQALVTTVMKSFLKCSRCLLLEINMHRAEVTVLTLFFCISSTSESAKASIHWERSKAFQVDSSYALSRLQLPSSLCCTPHRFPSSQQNVRNPVKAMGENKHEGTDWAGESMSTWSLGSPYPTIF